MSLIPKMRIKFNQLFVFLDRNLLIILVGVLGIHFIPILTGLDSFTKIGVTQSFIILDDGWQNTNVDDKMIGQQWFGPLTSFHANYKFHTEFQYPLDVDVDTVTVNQKCINEPSSLEKIIKLA